MALRQARLSRQRYRRHARCAALRASGSGGSADFFGWSVGGGAEVALNPNWSARFDYQFTDFSSEKVNYPGGSVTYDPDASTYRGSLIYRF